MRTLVIMLTMALFSTGCSTLILRDSESIPTKAAKVATRVVIALPTLGFSEVFILQAKEKEQIARTVRAYRAAIKDARIRMEQADTERERRIWEMEYRRYVSALRDYIAAIRAQRAARARIIQRGFGDAGRMIRNRGKIDVQEGVVVPPGVCVKDGVVFRCDR